MPDSTPRLTLACWDYDRVQPLFDGRAPIDGIELDCHALPTTTLFPLAVSQAKYDITEMSMSSYLMQASTGTSAYTAIPVFLSRAFRHSGFYVRTDAGIKSPSDLEGRIVGVPEYQMTAGLWMRGILASEYGVDLRRISYRTGGLDGGVRKERLPLSLPPGFVVEPMADHENLNDLLLDGAIDALFAPKIPRAFREGNPKIARLFPDFSAVEKAYFQKTGFFPIMHVVGIRSTLLDKYPWLAKKVYNAFVSSRDVALERLRDVWLGSANRLSLPWLHETMETTQDVMGRDYWRYGLADNYDELDWMCQQSVDQYLAKSKLAPEDIFVAV